MRQRVASLALCLACIMASLAPPTLADGKPAAVAASALPWSSLVYEQRSLWVTARSQLTLSQPDPARPELLQLRASSSVARNSEEVELDLVAGDLALRAKQRLSRGKNQRLKRYQYDASSIRRWRIEPAAGEAALAPQQWTQSRASDIALPAGVAGGVVSGSQALLLLATRIENGLAPADTSLYIHTDQNLYRVRLQAEEAHMLEVDMELDGAAITGTVAARGYRVLAAPVEPLADKPDFNLLGLSGDIRIDIDRERGLPLRISGQAPRVGAASVNLKAATTRG